MRATVTGASGFIGTNLCRMLTAQGWEVGTVGRIVTPYDHLSVIEQFKDFKPDVVFHLASLFVSEHSPADITPMIASNILFGTQILDAMVLAKTPRIVNVSTTWTHPSPRNLYAATKEAFGEILHYYSSAFGIGTVTLKLFDTYGPGDTRGKLVEKLIGWLADDATHPMLPKYHRIALAHVDDVCRAIILAANFTNGRGEYSMPSWIVTLSHLVDAIERLSQQSLRVQWGGRPYRVGEKTEPVAGIPPLPDFTPSIPLIEGLAGMLGVPVGEVS